VLPDASVVSEESEKATNSALNDATLFWLVDPLDGTKEFVKRTNEFGKRPRSCKPDYRYWVWSMHRHSTLHIMVDEISGPGDKPATNRQRRFRPDELVLLSSGSWPVRTTLDLRSP